MFWNILGGAYIIISSVLSVIMMRDLLNQKEMPRWEKIFTSLPVVLGSFLWPLELLMFIKEKTRKLGD